MARQGLAGLGWARYLGAGNRPWEFAENQVLTKKQSNRHQWNKKEESC